MTDKNPYQTPDAALERGHQSGDLHPPRTVSIGRGFSWFSEGFRLFAASPLMWILVTVSLVVAGIIVSLIPMVNLTVYIMMPVFMGGIMMGSQSLDSGNKFQFGHLFAGFSKIGPLLGVGVCYFLGNIIAITLAILLGSLLGEGMTQEFIKIFLAQDPNPNIFTSQSSMQIFLVIWLAYMGLLIPVLMATWFAPSLTALNDVGVIEALGMSFKACAKNILPFLLYGIVLLLAIILGMIPLFLGLIVVIPAIYASIYTSYKDIFVD